MPAASFQTLTLEYRVFDRCDGTTEAPPFSEGQLDERQIYVFEVQRLGVIPLRFGDEEELPEQPSTQANRFLTWSLLTGVPTANNFESGLGVGFAERDSGQTFPIEPVGQIALGSEGLYLQRCVKVPQGGVVLVNDIEAFPGAPAIVRLRVQRPENGEQQHQLELACCCKDGLADLDVPNRPSDDCPSNLTLIEVTPNQAAFDPTEPVEVTLLGSGFSELENLQVAFVQPRGEVPVQLPILEVSVLDDNTLQAQLLPNAPGVFDVFVGDPNIENCFAALTPGFTVQLA